MKPLDALRRARDLWSRAWPLWSVRVSALGALLTALAAATPDTLLQIWQALPDDARMLLPESVGRIVPTILFVLTIVVRMIPQTPADDRKSLLRSVDGKVRPMIPQTPADDRKSLLRSVDGKVRPKAAGGIAAAALLMIASVISVEGGHVNHPADPGGETNMGITKATAAAAGYVGPMKTLPRSVAESIYYDRYLVAPGYAPLVAIDAPVTEELFDTTVNMGPARPGRWFQLAINSGCGTSLKIDGRVGPTTIAAYKACQGRVGAAKLCVATLDRLDASQLNEYDRLVRRNPDLRVFHRGWVAHRIGNVDRRRCKAAAA